MNSKKDVDNSQLQANLRLIEWNNQCTLSFHLKYKSEDYRDIDEDIIAVRKGFETIDALLQHIKQKVLKLLQENKENVENANNSDTNQFPAIDLNISLKSTDKDLGSKQLGSLKGAKGLLFSILNTTYNVIVNAPLIESIKLPEIIYSGHPVQPAIFKAILTEHNKSKYTWYKSMDKEKWLDVGKTYYYNVSEDDIGYYLKFKCIPINNFTKGVPYEVISSTLVNKIPEVPYCPFEERHKQTTKSLSGNKLRIVSYNTLSCRYANNQFEHCPVMYLSIDYRKQLLLKELLGYNSDIICCQEVDNKIYSFYFRREFSKKGYGSIYHKKGNKIPEGLALFYKKDRFSYGGQGQIVFNDEIKSNHGLNNIKKLLDIDPLLEEMFMKQQSSLQYCKLIAKQTNKIIIVANTHLYYHPDANNVRLLQTAICLEFLRQLIKKIAKSTKDNNIGVIFCGDFNSTPMSDVYNFITTGRIEYKSEVSNTTLFHSFHFTSACGEPEFTNYTSDFKACLDYIFCDSFKVLKSVDFPSEDILSADIALPSRVFPSDHLALIADLEIL